jgi:hypothetical protein
MARAQHWTVDGLVDQFARLTQQMPSRKFCFILGAGASRPSGIPTGAEFVTRWVAELHQRLDHEHRPVECWATPGNLGIPGFEYRRRAEFYCAVFERRFRDDRAEGYAFLQDAMLSARPSFGYSVLAQVLHNTRHNVVVTTNFDNLVADALLAFAGVHAFTCGHESLAEFVRPHVGKPLIVKIHHDLFTGPLNSPAEVGRLAPEWEEVLPELLRQFTPIVLGYGGNDGGFMSILQNLPPGHIPGQMCWCYRSGDATPPRQIEDLVVAQRGAMVEIPGFDEFFLLLSERLGYDLMDQQILDGARTRADDYRREVEQLQQKISALRSAAASAGQLQRALTAGVSVRHDWWAADLTARAEPNLAVGVHLKPRESGRRAGAVGT